MNKKTITIEFLSYLIIFLIGVFVRLLKLGELPLSDHEARIALDGLNLALNNQVAMNSDQVFYTNLLGVLFYLFGTSTFISRLFSAMIGSILFLLPALFRQYFDRKALLIISFWLAISPTFVSLSRQVDSTLLVIVSSALSFYAFLRNKQLLGAFFLSISILSGKIFLWSVLLFCLTILYVILFVNEPEKIKSNTARIISHIKPKFTVLWLVIFYALLSTFGFIFPNQFSAVGRIIVAFWSSFTVNGASLSISDLARGIIFYEIAVVIFGIAGLVWLFRKNQVAGLSILGVVTINLIMIILVSEKSIAGLAFLLLPLIIAGSFLINHFLSFQNQNLGKIMIVTLIAFSILIFIGLAFISMFTNSNLSIEQTNTRILFIVAGFALIIGAGILAGWAISWEIAGRSFLILLFSVMIIFTTSAMWNASTLRTAFQNEILRFNRVPVQEDLLINTIQDHSSWNYGQKTKARILVVENEVPSLVWALRDFSEVMYSNFIPVGEVFDFFITGENQILELNDSYRGQDILWNSSPAWNTMGLREITTWVLTRRAPQDVTSQKSIIIWVRNSLVPGFEN